MVFLYVKFNVRFFNTKIEHSELLNNYIYRLYNYTMETLLTFGGVFIIYKIIKAIIILWLFKKYKVQILGFCRKYFGFLFSKN